MDLQDRFFGKGVPQPGGPTVANPRLSEPPSFQLLFASALELDADALTLALRDYHPELAQATAELLKLTPTPATQSPVLLGLIGWGRHAIKLVGFDSPLPADVAENCIRPAMYEIELKELAYRHAAHLVLHYAGYELDPFEQHVALAAASAALARFGAIVAANETAHTSIPAAALLPHEEDEGDMIRALRTLPIPYVYAGFVKIEVEGEPGVWMRTYGCSALRLPDLAFRAESHNRGSATFGLFSNMLDYLRKSGKSFAPGDTMGSGDGQFFHFRAPTAEEWFLESAGELLVIERLDPGEVQL